MPTAGDRRYQNPPRTARARLLLLCATLLVERGDDEQTQADGGGGFGGRGHTNVLSTDSQTRTAAAAAKKRAQLSPPSVRSKTHTQSVADSSNQLHWVVDSSPNWNEITQSICDERGGRTDRDRDGC